MIDTFIPVVAQTATASNGAAGFAWLALVNMVGVIAVVFIIPFILGAFFARALRMPTYGFPIGVILATIFGGLTIIYYLPARYGPDIKGGTILVYELDRQAESSDALPPGVRVTASQLVGKLTERINPTGTKEIIIRPYGEDQIEIIVPDVGQQEIDDLKRIVQQAGILKFRIVANRMDHAAVFERAREQSESEDIKVRLNSEVRDKDGNVIGVWHTVGKDHESKGLLGYSPLRSAIGTNDLARDSRTGKLIVFPTNLGRDGGQEKWLASQKIEDVDLLMSLVDRSNNPFEIVTGDDLAQVAKSTGNTGSPEVTFKMNAAGAQRLLKLTGKNTPTSNYSRRMAIILDGRVLSAPNLNSAISSSGVIQGNFTQKEVDFLVGILQSGSLPATLGKEPISESQIGSVLGADTIQRGFFASGLSIVVTLIFMLVYYRFSGVIACIALLMNMLLIYASILLIQQPITLPGLAGFVLSVGMSVDANVLVYERIREEVARRATGRMAIRNGFDNAMTTIIDSNLTTLISAIVLYAAGTDQIKGFAVPLIIGIVISMFTAVYCSRVFFDIAEKLRLASFSMMDAIAWARKSFLGQADIDFMGKRNLCYAISAALVLIGLVATGIRGKEFLDIDFNGGTSVVFSLDKSATADVIRESIKDSFAKDESGNPVQTSLTSISMKGQEVGTVYRLDSSLLDVSDLRQRLVASFASKDTKLVTYQLEAAPAASAEATATSYKLRFRPSKGSESAKINPGRLIEKISDAAKEIGQGLNAAQLDITPEPMPQGWTIESQAGFDTWSVKFPFNQETSGQIITKLQNQMETEPVWLSVNKIGTRVAGQMQFKAIASVIISLVFITMYIWFRFHSVAYGIAAVIALVHDVLITLGLMALSHWLYRPLGFLQIDDFKISLTVVAAFLTIIGYSLNDTIVVFDRIREVKGKSPTLTGDMINKSVNETLGRTLLTSSTTIIAILLLFFMGGEGIHGFAFALFFGILTGTYSSIFVAAPILLWFVSREQKKAALMSNVSAATR